jgi:hypothetical protein
MLGYLIVYFFEQVINSLYIFYQSTGLKWVVALSFFFLNFVSYYQNPPLYSDSKNCFANLPCRWFQFIAGVMNLTLNLLGIIGLWYCAPFTKYLPDYWYIPLAILSYAVLIQITLSVKTAYDDGSFNPPPTYLWDKKSRVWLNVIITILDIIFFHQMYLDGGKLLIENPRVMDDLILGRFGGWNESKFEFVLGWWGIFGLIIDLIAVYYTYYFRSCDYNLPSSWDY